MASLTLNHVFNETEFGDSLNLLGYADGFDLAENGWVPKTPLETEYSRTLLEVLTLRVRAGSADALAATLQLLDEYIQHVERSRDAADFKAVWLTAQIDDESLPRRALIVRMSYELEHGFYDYVVESTKDLPTLILKIERSPFWEAPYDGQSMPPDPLTNIDASGSKAPLIALIAGDVPARLSWARFYADNNAVFSQIWAGWRTTRWGAPANFVETWSLHDGVDPTLSDLSNASDATAFDGTRVDCDFTSGDEWALRSIVRVSHVTANPNDQRGRFLVLLRAKVATTTATPTIIRAGLSFGFNNFMPVSALESETMLPDKKLITADGKWHWYEMGVASIPPIKRLMRQYGDDALNNCALGLYVERFAGAEDLQLDCYRLIPVNDGYVHLESEADVSAGGTIESLVAATDPLGEASAFAASQFDGAAQHILWSAAITAPGWAGPNHRADYPYLVFAHESIANGSELSIDLAFEYLVYARWRTLRGADWNPFGTT